MKDLEQALNYLNKYKYNELYTFTEMSKRSGVSRTTISRILEGDNVGVHAFFKLLESLNLQFTIKEKY